MAIIYLIFAQTLPLTICFVFDKFFLRFLPVIASCFGFIWQMTSTKKTFQSIKRRSQEVNVVQADLNAILTSAKTVNDFCADGKRSMFHFFSVPLKNPEKRFGEKNECSSVWLHQPKSLFDTCLLYTSPSPRDGLLSRMPSSA